MTTKVYIRPSENSTPEVVSLLTDAADDTELIFENAEYHFFSAGVHRGYFAPTNNDSGEKSVVFPLLGKKNITLTGNGARFVFHSRLFPFIISGCENIAVNDISVDFSFPRYAVGKTAGCDKDGFSLKVDAEKYPFSVADGNLIFAAGEEVRTTALKKFFLSGMPGEAGLAVYLVAGDTVDPLKNLPAPVLMTDAEEISEGLIRFTYRPDSARIDLEPGRRLLISHDENRENDVFFIENSAGVILRNIDIYRGAGMGVIGQTSRDITIENMKVAVPAWRCEPVSITADAFHFVHCEGRLNIRGCTVCDTLDDAVNIHGIYTLAEAVSADRALLRLGHHEQYGFNPYRAGDALRIIGPNGEKGCAVVRETSISGDGSKINVRFDRDVSSLIAHGDHIENPGRMPEVLIENNTFHRCPHVLLGSNRKTVVRNNDLMLSGGLVLVDNMKYWYESGPVEDVSIENNIFRTDAAAVSAVLHGAEDTGRRHRNIRIANNPLIGKGALLDAEYVDGLHVRGHGKITLNNCTNVTTGENDI